MTDENVVAREIGSAAGNQDIDGDLDKEEERCEADDGEAEEETEQPSIARLLQLEAACVDALRPHVDLLWSKTEMPEECEIEGEHDEEQRRLQERCTAILYACLTQKRAEVEGLLADLELNEALEAVQEWLRANQPTTKEDVSDGDGLDADKAESANGEDAEEDCSHSKEARISHREILELTQATFVDWMRMDRALIAYLQAHSVLNEETSSRVLCRPSRPEQIRCLIQLLKELGPQSLLVFIDALQLTQQTSLARILSAKVSI